MTKKTTLATDDALLAAVDQFAHQVLADGCNPAELSCALTAVAVRIALDLAPSAGIAFAVVMRAVSDAAAQWASSQASGHESSQEQCGLDKRPKQWPR
jgi:hypothetical protein